MHNAVTAEESALAFSHERPEGILAFLALRSKNSARELAPSATDVFKGCSDAINPLLRAALEARSEVEFDRIFEAVFPKYVALTMAMSHFASAVVPTPQLERLTRESIGEMEADLQDKGLAAFGAAVRDQALFTVWTLRKVNELVRRIVAIKPNESKKKDAEYCANFNFNTFRAHFSLDCLHMALENGQPVYPEVLEKLIDGLRSMANAYAWARRGLEARIPSAEPALIIPELDQEDRDLMEASFGQGAELLNDESD